MPQGQRIEVTDDMLQDVRSRLLAGAGTREIADDYSFSTGAVSRLARTAGIQFVKLPGDIRRVWYAIENIPPELLAAADSEAAQDTPDARRAPQDAEEQAWSARLDEMSALLEQAEARINELTVESEKLSQARAYQFQKAHDLERHVKELEQAKAQLEGQFNEALEGHTRTVSLMEDMEDRMSALSAQVRELTPAADAWNAQIAEQARQADRTGAREAYTRAGSVIERMKGLLGGA